MTIASRMVVCYDASMSGKKNNQKLQIVGGLGIIIIIILLLFLKGCSGCERKIAPIDPTPTPIVQNEDQSILQVMKADEKYLFELYEAPNICEKEWVEEYRELGKKFQKYVDEYTGSDEEIKALLTNYIEYGKQIEKIAISIDISNYEEGVKQLEELKDTAKENEKELQRLYDKYFNS